MNNHALPAPSIIRWASHEPGVWRAAFDRYQPGSDLLLLAPDAEIADQSIAELQAVVHLAERHGLASPRSGNGRLAFPAHADLEPEASYRLWQQASSLLPRYERVPLADPSCVLIKAELVERFAPFDPLFVSAAGALDEFACRVNRRGYSTLAANRAYAFSTPAADISEADRELLLYRFPEHERGIQLCHDLPRDPVENFAVLYHPHRPRVLYDLFHLTGTHSGTSDFGLNLLRELARLAAGEFDLYVGTHVSERPFLNELSGYRLYDDTTEPAQVFDLAFKPCQFLSWADFRRLDRFSPRLSFTLLDLIGVRCDYLNSPSRQAVVQNAARLCDFVFTLSDFVAADFAAFFGERLPFRSVHLAASFGLSDEELLPGEHVLVVGNNFAHKGLDEAIRALRTNYPVVVLGGEIATAAPNVRWLPSGSVTRQHVRDLFARARVVVYPSYYEGFGLPVAEALALGKPVVVLDTAVNRELQAALRDPNLHSIPSFATLAPTVAALLEAEPVPRSSQIRRWNDVAADYLTVFRELLKTDWNPERVRERRNLLRLVASHD